MQILRIDSATTGENSVSRELTQAIVDRLLAENPGANLVERNLATDPLPHIDPVTTGAIRLPQDSHDEAMAVAFPAERAVLDEFLASDVIVIGAPMYNFTIPSALKAWLDRLGVPGVTFTYRDGAPVGLARRKSASDRKCATGRSRMHGSRSPNSRQRSGSLRARLAA